MVVLEILGLLVAVAFAFAVAILAPILGWAALIIFSLWPTLVGVGLGAWLWVRFGYDNAGALLGVGGIVGNFVWVSWFGSGPKGDPMAGKRRRYERMVR